MNYLSNFWNLYELQNESVVAYKHVLCHYGVSVDN